MTQTASDPRSTGSWVIRTPLDRPIRGIARRVGGSKAKEVERFLKFAVVGVIGALVDFGTLNLLLHTILPAVDSQGNPLGIMLPGGYLFENVGIATTIAFAAAVLSNFMWNRIWTYPDSRSRSLRRQLFLFGVVSLVGWLARLVWIKWSYLRIADILVTSMEVSQASSVNLSANIAQLIAVGVVMIWNFVVNRFWTYNDVK